MTPFLHFNLPWTCPVFPCLVAQHHSKTTLPTLFTYIPTTIFLHNIPSPAPPTVAFLAVSFVSAQFSLPFLSTAIPRLFGPSNHDPQSYSLRRNTTTDRTALLSTVHLHSANPPALHTASRDAARSVSGASDSKRLQAPPASPPSPFDRGQQSRTRNHPSSPSLPLLVLLSHHHQTVFDLIP